MSDCEAPVVREGKSSREVRSPRRSRSGSPSGRQKNRSPERRGHRRRRSTSPSRSRSHSRRSYSRDRSPKDKTVGTRENPKPCRCLGVFGLSLNTKERELKDMFRKCGSIENCTIVYDKRTGRSRGFGFVRFKHQEDADEARELMNGREFDNRKIRVDYSVTQRPHSPTPGVYMGRIRDTGRSSRYYDGSSFRDRDRYSSRSRSPRSRSRSPSRSRSRSYGRRR